MTTRYRLTLEYDGTGLVGWQRQDNGPSVQQCLEEAIEAFCGEQVTAHAAGRTDAGVHALGQAVHVDIDRDTSAFRVQEAVNHHLKPNRIAVTACEAVDQDFHARFSATERGYLYRIANRRAPLTLDHGKAWLVPAPLDAGAMHAAALELIGKHDFSSFRAAECQAKSPVKTLDEISVTRLGEEIEVRARARSFLHHQVRNIVGSLSLIGQGKKKPGWIRNVLEARDRTRAGPTAPAHGLYLTHVKYD